MEINERTIELEYINLLNRLVGAYKTESGYQLGKKYIRGLLSATERKNGWQLSEYIGQTTPYAIQQFLYRGKVDADVLRDELRNCIGEKLGEPAGVLVVDETGFLKQGKKSRGVKRRDSGAGGELSNRSISDIRE